MRKKKTVKYVLMAQFERVALQAFEKPNDQEQERSRLTSEALADVVAGDVIDHQAVRAWVCRLTTDAPLPMSC